MLIARRVRSLLSSARRASVGLAFALGASLCGCGGSGATGNGLASRSPAQIVSAAEHAALGAATVHVAGSIVGEGKPISIDMELVAGKGGMGRVALGGMSVELIELDKTLYLRGSSSFYARVAGPAIAPALTGRWLEGRAASRALAPLSALTRLGALLRVALARHAALVRAADGTVDGRRALAVEDVAGDATLYVAASGTPYPLELVRRGVRAGTVAFTGWDQPVALAPPAHAFPVNQLEGRR
jgi:hypothetical protein